MGQRNKYHNTKKHHLLIMIVAVILFTFVRTNAKINRVPADFVNIQSAVNASSNGDTVVVYPGTYYENVILRGKKIVLTSRFYETSDVHFISSTIINGSQPLSADTASCVLVINGEDSTMILQGFTITGGKGTAWLDEHGAGKYREGGGILVAHSSPIIKNNLITNNKAVDITGVTSTGGGGIRAGDGNPSILNNVMTQNRGRYGGALVLNFTGASVKNNIFYNNFGGEDYGGGTIWMNHPGSYGKVIENNTIVANAANGGGIYEWSGSSVIVRNNIIWGNTSSSALQLSVRAGTLVTYCTVQGGWAGAGNINIDPQFSDSLFNLMNTSPCIDAGDSSQMYNDIADPNDPANARFPSHGSVRNDMGAYGGPEAQLFLDFRLPTGVGSSGNYIPTAFSLQQNYPNPFNPSTKIEFTLRAPALVSLKIFDGLGREVAELISERLAAGNYSYQWNASGFPSGIYFYRFQAGTSRETKKLVLVK
jgi:hypothetical protein